MKFSCWSEGFGSGEDTANQENGACDHILGFQQFNQNSKVASDPQA